MKSLCSCAAILLMALITGSCNRNKPKPISNNINKTTVLVNGQKDSVINNPQKNYGTATISDPCNKLLLQNIQASNSFKELTQDKVAFDISYTINWVEAAEPKLCTNGTKITNGIEVAVNANEGNTKTKIGSFIYNNEDAKLYYINHSDKYDELQNVDARVLKQIRNGCYWGVASHK